MYPTKTEEYFIFQTLVGTFPPGREPQKNQKLWQEYRQRIRDYVIKAFREAKINTNWLMPHRAYEDAVLKYVDALLEARSNPFLDNFREFLEGILPMGGINSLSQVILKVCSPGIPDFYQGCEYWDLSLVDPDNRRAVDYGQRRRSLRQTLSLEKKKGAGIWKELLDGLFQDLGEDPSIKQYLTHRLLRIRKEYFGLLTHGTHEGIKALGARKNNVVAFVRKHEGRSLLVVVPRFLYKPLGDQRQGWTGGFWGDTRLLLEPGRNLLCRNLLTGKEGDWGPERDLETVLDQLPFGVVEIIIKD